MGADRRRTREARMVGPDGASYELKQRLSLECGLGADQFVIGNGSNEIIELLARG